MQHTCNVYMISFSFLKIFFFLQLNGRKLKRCESFILFLPPGNHIASLKFRTLQTNTRSEWSLTLVVDVWSTQHTKCSH
jgi:hypothetical protein